MADVKGNAFLVELRKLLRKYGDVNMYGTYDGTVLIQAKTENGNHVIAEMHDISVASIKTHLNTGYGRGLSG